MIHHSPHSLEQILPELTRNDADYLRWIWTTATSEVLRHRPDKFCHFLRIANIDIGDFEEEVDRTPEEFWSEYGARKQLKVQKETDSIILRKVKLTRSPDADSGTANSVHVHEDIATKHAQYYPSIMNYLLSFAGSMHSILSRAMIVRLSPNKQVYPHFDAGYYYLIRDRYHLVIRSPQGSKMRCMNDFSVWQKGELWWFNNKVEHEAFNAGDDWRIHLIFDLLPKHLVPLMEEIKKFTPYYQRQRAVHEAGTSASPAHEESFNENPEVHRIITEAQKAADETASPYMLDGSNDIRELEPRHLNSGPGAGELSNSGQPMPAGATADIQIEELPQEPAAQAQQPQLAGAESTRSWLAQSISSHCVFTSATEELVSSSGKKQNWLIDLRKLFARAEALEALADEFFKLFPSHAAFQLAGMETASIPLLTALALVGARNGKAASVAIIRKERKHTGRGRSIEGDLGDQPVTLVDDVLNTGGSAEKARVSLAQAGARIARVFVVIDYQSAEGMAWRKRHGIEVHSLFTLRDFGLQLAKTKRATPTRTYRSIWGFQAEGASPYHVVPKSAPLLVDNMLYFGSDKGSFWALDAASGHPVWEFKARVTHPKGIWSSPAHHDGRVYFGTYNGNVHCLDAKTGAEVWCHSACEWVGSSPLILPEHGTLVIGLEYARPRTGGSVCALSLASGAKVWEQWLRVVQHGSCAHWRGGDLVISGTNDHNVVALQAATGETAWIFNTRRSVKYAPAIDEERGLVAFASFDGSIYILKVASGEKVAEFKTGNICYTTPLFAQGKLFCGSGDRHFYVIDLDTMSIALKMDCQARVYSSPRLIDGCVIFGTNAGVVYEMDPLSLDLVGRLTLPDAVPNAVAFTSDGRHIFVPTSMNEIYLVERA
jgi:orotate phosphoribosyltransferase